MKSKLNSRNINTSDMWLAAVLMALGEDMVGVERGLGPRATFIFAHSPSIEQAIVEYKAGKVRIEPQKLFVQTKLLKSRLYD